MRERKGKGKVLTSYALYLWPYDGIGEMDPHCQAWGLPCSGRCLWVFCGYHVQVAISNVNISVIRWTHLSMAVHMIQRIYPSNSTRCQSSLRPYTRWHYFLEPTSSGGLSTNLCRMCRWYVISTYSSKLTSLEIWSETLAFHVGTMLASYILFSITAAVNLRRKGKMAPLSGIRQQFKYVRDPDPSSNVLTSVFKIFSCSLVSPLLISDKTLPALSTLDMASYPPGRNKSITLTSTPTSVQR